MTWAELHSKSEKFAIEAQLALKARDYARAVGLYKQAAEFEEKALNALDKSKNRTIGITAVSAVALWYKAKEYDHAEAIAYRMLSVQETPKFAREELRNLIQAIWTEGSKQKAGVGFMPGQVTVSIQGGAVVTGGAPLDLIVDKVQTIQAMFYRTIEYLSDAPHRKKGPPSKEFQDACRPWLFQAAPGSYQFTVAIQQPDQRDLFKKEIEPERIASHFLEIVSAASSQDKAELENIVSDENYRNTFLKLARNLAPTGRNCEVIELRSAGETKPVSLGTESRSHINQQLKKETSPSAKEDRVEELRGTLRALHLDEDWLNVVVEGKSMRIVGLQDAVDDVIGPMVNRSVVVKVTRKNKKIKFVDIELEE